MGRKKQDRKTGKFIRCEIKRIFESGNEPAGIAVYCSDYGTHEIMVLTESQIDLIRKNKRHKWEGENTLPDDIENYVFTMPNFDTTPRLDYK